jgi:type VI secretion system secreted protein VgrG
MEEDEAQYLVLTGTSLARAFASGQQFELTEHRDMAGKYALVSVHHNISQSPSYVSGTSVDNHYQNSFVCIPSTVPFHPHRVTPKPIVQGPQTAVVTVKSGEEMWLDKYGRVRVQFHWDREGKNDEKTTCWVRVAQIWAGTNWGAHFWPRVGQEVVVDFLEGDPDRPLVTGSVYNATNMPPYDLPGNHTRSGIKSRSTKGGGASDYNEIRLEDKKGDEQVFLHAQKDMDVRVENDSREYVGHDLHLIVKKNQQEEVDGDKSLEVKGDHSEKIGGKMSLDVSSDRHEKVGTNYAVESGQEIHIKGGMKVIIEAGMQLTIKAAGSFVDVGPAGVTIQGTMVNINSGGSAGSGSGVNLKSPLKADVADDGTKGKKLN